MILHLLVDVEVRCRGRIEARQQLVHDDQQLHLPRFFDELLFDRLLEILDSVHGLVFGFVEPVGEHFAVDVVLPQLLGQALAGLFAFDVGG